MAHNSRAKASWSNGDEVSGARLEVIDQNGFEAINGDDGGVWAPAALIQVGGLGIKARNVQRVVIGADANTTYSVADAAVIILDATITAPRTYTISTAGAQTGDEIMILATYLNAFPVQILGPFVAGSPPSVGIEGRSRYINLIYSATPSPGWYLGSEGQLQPFPSANAAGLWYRCDSSSGALVNYGSVGTADLTAGGTAKYRAVTPARHGVVVGGGAFSGATNLAVYNSAGTVSALFCRMVEGSAASQTVWGRHSAASAKRFAIYSDSTHEICVDLDGTFGSVTLASGVIVTEGVWYHVAATYDGVNAAIYVNGIQCNLQAAVGSLTSAAGEKYILGSSGFHSTVISDCRSLDSALTQDQIAEMAASVMRWQI